MSKKHNSLWVILECLFYEAWHTESHYSPRPVIEKTYKKVLKWRTNAFRVQRRALRNLRTDKRG